MKRKENAMLLGTTDSGRSSVAVRFPQKRGITNRVLSHNGNAVGMVSKALGQVCFWLRKLNDEEYRVTLEILESLRFVFPATLRELGVWSKTEVLKKLLSIILKEQQAKLQLAPQNSSREKLCLALEQAGAHLSQATTQATAVYRFLTFGAFPETDIPPPSG